MSPSQLVLDLAHPESWDEIDFLVTGQNEQAMRLVHAWPEWHAPAATIFGPPKSGKTYLAKIWQARSSAEFIAREEIKDHRWEPPWQPLIIEDIDAGALPETALFHLLNLAREHGSFILFTAETPPGQWMIALPDLRSRLRSYPAVEIKPPDEQQLAALLVKHFGDRRIEVTPEVISYLVSRMERSMAAAKAVTAYIDKLALSEHRRITRALAAKAFKELDAAANDNEENIQGEML